MAASTRTFQSTHPLRGATIRLCRAAAPGFISIHAPLAGCDETYKIAQMGDAVFQSTHPLRGATCLAKLKDKTDEISIHAPLAGCDLIARPAHHVRLISIHAPLAGRDPVELIAGLHDGNFNPRAPCGARPCRRHAQVGATLHFRYRMAHTPKFQSTRPLRGATGQGARGRKGGGISIHAPLAGRDRCCRASSSHRFYFNPRAPCGARPRSYNAGAHFPAISIHAPLAGRDQQRPGLRGRARDFNPRAPCGARRPARTGLPSPVRISIHAPLAGRDGHTARILSTFGRFQSTRPLRGATANLTNSYPQICAKVTKGTC